jgi:hypothetical protein
VADAFTFDSMTSECVYSGNCPASFTYYNFTTSITAEKGVSSATVEIIDGDTASSVFYRNGGNGFPLDDKIQLIRSMSNVTTRGIQNTINLTVAVSHPVRKSKSCGLTCFFKILNADQFTNVTATFYTSNLPTNSGQGFIEDDVAMTRLQEVESTDYTYYTLLHDVQGLGAIFQPFDLKASGPKGTISNTFISWENIPFINIDSPTSSAVPTPTLAPH